MNTQRLSKLGILILLANLLLAGMMVTATDAAPTTNVGLVRFEAIPLDNAIRLEWETATEVGTAGFHLKRDGAYLNNTAGSKLFIPGEGGVAVGNSYEHLDATAVNNQTYTYELIEVETSGLEVTLESRTVTAGLKPTNTPISVGGNNTRNAATATRAAATPTATADIDATPQATASPTPRATQTVAQAATATPPPFATAATNTGSGGTTAAQQPNTFPTQPPVDEVAAIEVDSDAVLAAEPGTDPYPVPGGGAGDALATSPPETSPAVEGYPAGTDGSQNNGGSAAPIVIGGDQTNPQNLTGLSPRAQEAATGTTTTGRLYLFGGFIVALLIFITAVFGAIVLYTRKQSPNG